MDYKFKKMLAYAITLHKQGYHEKSSEILDTLADTLLYADTYKKSLDDSLTIVKSLKIKAGQETTKFLVMKIRDDREMAFTVDYKQELLELLPDDRVDKKDNSVIVDKIYFLIAGIRNNQKLLSALQKNCSAQYINRIIKKDKDLSFLHAAKLKKFFQLYEKLI